MPNFVNMS